MNLFFLEPARTELDQATAYYESQRAGLGQEFTQEINKSYLAGPGPSRGLDTSIRCCHTSRFPYGVVYNIRGEDVLILAIMHLHRKPGYWKNRL